MCGLRHSEIHMRLNAETRQVQVPTLSFGDQFKSIIKPVIKSVVEGPERNLPLSHVIS